MTFALPQRLGAPARLSTLASVLFIASAAAVAQQAPASPAGSIHGRVINPAGVPQPNGAVSLSLDGGATLSYNFPVSSSGVYSGQAPPGEYTVVYRAPDTPEGKIVDYINSVDVVAGQDTAQDIDMTRTEFIARLSPEQQQQLQALKQANAAAAEAAKLDSSSVEADLEIASLDFMAAQNAHDAAAQSLGATGGREDVESVTAEIENAKLTEVETLMSKDAVADPGEPVVWIDMARAEIGFKNYLDAETHFKKALDLALKEDPPRAEIVAAAQAGLGEVYARTLLVDEAGDAYEAAAKADPAHAEIYLRNQVIVFLDARNFAAEVDAADTAIKFDPRQAELYYFKAEGLAQSATLDPETNKLILPPGCAEAFEKYLDLDPDGAHAAQVKGILGRVREGAGATPGATGAGPASAPQANAPAQAQP